MSITMGLIFGYFIINTFFAGYCFSQDPDLNSVGVCMIFGTIILSYILIEALLKEAILKVDNFFLIRIQFYYIKGRYDNMDDGKMEILQHWLDKSKWNFQKRIFTKIKLANLNKT